MCRPALLPVRRWSPETSVVDAPDSVWRVARCGGQERRRDTPRKWQVPPRGQGKQDCGGIGFHSRWMRSDTIDPHPPWQTPQAAHSIGALIVGGFLRRRGTFLCTAALNLGSTFCAWRLLRRRVLAQRGLKRVSSDPSLLAGPSLNAPEDPPGPGLRQELARLSSRVSGRVAGDGRGDPEGELGDRGGALDGRGVGAGLGSRLEALGERGRASGGRRDQRAMLEVALAPSRGRTGFVG